MTTIGGPLTVMHCGFTNESSANFFFSISVVHESRWIMCTKCFFGHASLSSHLYHPRCCFGQVHSTSCSLDSVFFLLGSPQMMFLDGKMGASGTWTTEVDHQVGAPFIAKWFSCVRYIGNVCDMSKSDGQTLLMNKYNYDLVTYWVAISLHSISRVSFFCDVWYAVDWSDGLVVTGIPVLLCITIEHKSRSYYRNFWSFCWRS